MILCPLCCVWVKAYLDYGSAKKKGQVHSLFNWKCDEIETVSVKE